MILNNEARELIERLEDVLTGRIQQMAQEKHDINEASVASLANHYTALRAVEWFRDRNSAFFD